MRKVEDGVGAGAVVDGHRSGAPRERHVSSMSGSNGSVDLKICGRGGQQGWARVGD
jgi:hypothetical protein